MQSCFTVHTMLEHYTCFLFNVLKERCNCHAYVYWLHIFINTLLSGGMQVKRYASLATSAISAKPSFPLVRQPSTPYDNMAVTTTNYRTGNR